MFYQTQTARRPPKGRKMPFLSLVTLTFKLVRVRDRVNLAQIRSAVPEIFHTQTKKNHRLTAPKTEQLRAVKQIQRI